MSPKTIIEKAKYEANHYLRTSIPRTRPSLETLYEIAKEIAKDYKLEGRHQNLFANKYIETIQKGEKS